MTQKIIAAFSLLALAWGFHARSQGSPVPQDCLLRVEGGAVRSTESFERCWKANEKVILRSLNGKKIDLARFQKAIKFFEEITRIPSSAHLTYYGRLPTPELREDLEAWREWLSENSSSVYWDEEGKEFRVRR